MNCPYCGQPNEAGAAFCGNCGRPLSAGANPTAQPSQPTPAPAPLPAQPAPVASAQTMPQPAMPGVGMAAGIADPAKPISHPGENKAMISVVLGAIGIPGALLPIAGLACGIAGLVLGTMARSKAKHKMSLVGISLSIIAVGLSLAAWIYNFEHDPHLHKGSSGSTSLVTPCYSAKVNAKLTIASQDICNIEAYDGTSVDNSSEAYAIEAVSSPSLTAKNFVATVKSEVPTISQALTSGKTFSMTGQRSGKFAGAPAYFIDYKEEGTSMEIAAAFHQSANGDNLFVFVHIKNSSGTDTSYLANNLTWK